MNYLAIIQARIDSKRLPGKVIKKINNKTLLEILILRLSKSKKISKIVVACSKNLKDKKIIEICNDLGIDYFTGSEDDVLDRFYNVAKKYNAKNIVRITADCPLIDPYIVDEVVSKFEIDKVDYVSNTLIPSFPDGLDVEVFSFLSLKESWLKTSKIDSSREHVTSYIKKNKKFKKSNYSNSIDYSFIRVTVDEPLDLKLVGNIINYFKNNLMFNFDEFLKYYQKNKSLFLINAEFRRNEGEKMNEGQKYWRRAQNSIAGGTMLFSKNPDLFLPGHWPAYFKKTSGCNIWDMQDRKLIDMSFMGVGTNTLGYSNSYIDNKVHKVINQGTMSTLNSIEEILLAENLLALHPWFEQARFTRSGGEANAVAIRLARAATGKEKIAICGYHGWHDWYLSTNLDKKNSLDFHLFKDAPIEGVPKSLKKTSFSFEYNNFESLKKIVAEHELAAIKMEVQRDSDPENNFLSKVQKLAKQKKIVLIFDECTSGFRETFGGLHKKYKVYPDMCILGKALGNGYAINAILGKKEIMAATKKTFISSTFWTERIGPTAALATLEIMEKLKSWKKITQTGKLLKAQWKKLAKSNNIKIKIGGIDAIPNFQFTKNHLIYKTLISQELLKSNIMASNVVYCSISHTKKIINNYISKLDVVFKLIKKIEDNKLKIENILTSKVCISGFRNIKK